MADKVIVTKNKLDDLADSISTKAGVATPMTLNEMKNAVDSIQIGGAGPLQPYIFDLKLGYIAAGKWVYENPTNTYIDIYEVNQGHHYFITLGANVGTRFRAMFSTTDVSTQTSDVTGTQITNLNNPDKFSNASYAASANGYILIAKDNVGKANIKSYVYDCEQSWQ